MNPGFLFADGAGGGGPLVNPVRANWSRSALETAALAAAPAALPAAAVARSVKPPCDAGVEAGNRCGLDAKYSSSKLKNACFSPAGRFAIIVTPTRA